MATTAETCSKAQTIKLIVRKSFFWDMTLVTGSAVPDVPSSTRSACPRRNLRNLSPCRWRNYVRSGPPSKAASHTKRTECCENLKTRRIYCSCVDCNDRLWQGHSRRQIQLICCINTHIIRHLLTLRAFWFEGLRVDGFGEAKSYALRFRERVLSETACH